MPGSKSPAEVIAARVARVRDMIRVSDTQDGFLARICTEFGVSKATACKFLAQARAEMGEALPLEGHEFDQILSAELLISQPTSPPNIQNTVRFSSCSGSS